MDDESPYLYPGTNVLRNKWDIRDQAELAKMEQLVTNQRLEELQERPIRGNFDAEHLCAIHRYIFQNAYEWAGDLRVREITKHAKGERQFSYADEVSYDLKHVMASLTRDDHLRNLDRATFCARAAYHLGELNTVHPFREGNGRTQGEFFRLLAKEAGHRLDWTLARPGQFTAARNRYVFLKPLPVQCEYDLNRRPEEFLEQLFLSVTARDAEPTQRSVGGAPPEQTRELDRAIDNERHEQVFSSVTARDQRRAEPSQSSAREANQEQARRPNRVVDNGPSEQVRSHQQASGRAEAERSTEQTPRQQSECKQDEARSLDRAASTQRAEKERSAERARARDEAGRRAQHQQQQRSGATGRSQF